MLTGISTVDEVIEFFEVWLMKQGLFNPTEHNADDARIYQKACDLINDDVDFWANTPMWDLYNKAKE
jgi:hypothetical protein